MSEGILTRQTGASQRWIEQSLARFYQCRRSRVDLASPAERPIHLIILAPLDETRANRRDCSGSPRPLPRRHHPRCRTTPECFRAFRHHDYTRAPPHYAFRSIVDLTTLHFFSPTLQIGGKSVCSV